MAQTLNDMEREQWVANDEGLYNWWRWSIPRISLRQFVKENRDELTRIILEAINKPPRG